ncbi:MAG: polysaccharide biosynthesis/export family protein [Nannocystaceae bacterium]
MITVGSGPVCRRKAAARKLLHSGGLWFVLGLALVAVACGTPRYRFDRRNIADKVEHRDLARLIADGEGSPQHFGARVEVASYDFRNERDEYRLGKNDLLNVFVVNHPEMSSQRVNLGEISGTRVQKDGNVYLPVVGPVRADGYDVVAFQTVLRTAVGRFVHDPQVTVDVLKHESQKFFVLGQVRLPGTFAVDGDTTLLEGIGMAGGILDTGNLEAAHVIRNGNLMPINLGDMLSRGDVSRNIFMRDRDTVYIPDNLDQKVYVLGEVAQPRVVPIVRSRLTLAEALAAAGGPTAAMARRELAVIRGGFAKPIVYTLDMEEALLYDERIRLRNGDRVIVAPTGLATSSRYARMILPFLQGAQAAGVAAGGGVNVVNSIVE